MNEDQLQIYHDGWTTKSDLRAVIDELVQELEVLHMRLADLTDWNSRLLAAPQQMVICINKLEALCKLQHDQLDIANSIIDNEYPADHIDEFYNGESRRAALKTYEEFEK